MLLEAEVDTFLRRLNSKRRNRFLNLPHYLDIGPRFPFYEEYMAGIGGLSNPEDVRIGTLISLIASFVPHFGNLSILEGLWSEVGNFTNHQKMFGDLDWSSTMITVSRCSFSFSFLFRVIG